MFWGLGHEPFGGPFYAHQSEQDIGEMLILTQKKTSLPLASQIVMFLFILNTHFNKIILWSSHCGSALTHEDTGSIPGLSRLRFGIAMSCGVGQRCGLDPMLLWPWCRPAATAPIRLLGNFYMPQV